MKSASKSFPARSFDEDGKADMLPVWSTCQWDQNVPLILFDRPRTPPKHFTNWEYMSSTGTLKIHSVVSVTNSYCGWPERMLSDGDIVGLWVGITKDNCIDECRPLLMSDYQKVHT